MHNLDSLLNQTSGGRNMDESKDGIKYGVLGLTARPWTLVHVLRQCDFMSIRQAIIFMNYDILFPFKANYISRSLLT